jgi:hypothetical protein
MFFKELSLDENGVIRNPSLHDANVIGVITFESKQALVITKLINGEIKILRLSDVILLNINELKEGNIILDCTVESGPSSDIEQAFEDLGMDNVDDPKNYLQSLRERISSNELKIVTINPSYGCTICVLCKKIEYQDAANDASGLIAALKIWDSTTT